MLLASCDQPGKSSSTEATPEAAPEFKPPAQVEAPALKFELTVTLNDPADLRVKEGDRIRKGQILAERQPSEQQRYARARLQTQLNTPRPIPEQTQLVAANGELAATQTLLDSLPETSRILDPQLRRTTKYIEKELELKAKLAGQEAAIAALQTQVEAARVQVELERQQLQDQLKVLEGELDRLKVRSPYTGTIRRLKVERGTNNEVVAKLKIHGEP